MPKEVNFDEMYAKYAAKLNPNASQAATKTASKAVNNAKKNNAIRSGQATIVKKDNGEGAKIARLLEDDNIQIKLVSKNIALQVLQARNEKNLSQEDLAKLVNVHKSVIRDIEAATYKHDGQLIAKIAQKLNTKFKKD